MSFELSDMLSKPIHLFLLLLMMKSGPHLVMHNFLVVVEKVAAVDGELLVFELEARHDYVSHRSCTGHRTVNRC